MAAHPDADRADFRHLDAGFALFVNMPNDMVTKGHCPDDILSQFVMTATTESAITQIWGTGLAIASQPPLFLEFPPVSHTRLST